MDYFTLNKNYICEKGQSVEVIPCGAMVAHLTSNQGVASSILASGISLLPTVFRSAGHFYPKNSPNTTKAWDNYTSVVKLPFISVLYC